MTTHHKSRDYPACRDIVTDHHDRRAVAEIRVQMALDSIQEARRLIEQAAQALAGVTGMIPACQRVGSIFDWLTQTWYSVSARANRLRCKGHLEARHRR
jgi:hypothetical protein